MKFFHFPALRTAALLLTVAGSASAAAIQFSITSLAPADSLAIELALLQISPLDLTDFVFTPATGGFGESIPQLGFAFGLNAPSSPFPPAGGVSLPLLFPGDKLTFTLSEVDLSGQRALHFGAGLFAQALIADAGGVFIGADLILTAGGIAEFASDAGGPLRLVIPGSLTPGPDSIAPGTPLLRVTAVPEPGAGMLLTFSSIALALRRCRR